MESRITGERIGNILVRNGFLRYAELVKAILKLSPEYIVFEKAFNARIPHDILEEYNIVVSAETNENVYLSTLANESVVRQLASPYYP